MARMLTIIITLSLTCCVIIGSKEVLTIEDGSPWLKRTLMSRVSYFYECNENSFSFDEIKITSRTSAYGPILPIIPSGRETDNSTDELKLRLEIVGEVSKKYYIEDDFKLIVNANGKKIVPRQVIFSKLTEFEYNNDLWVQYEITYSYKVRLGELNSLTIGIKSTFDKCNIPPINLTRQKLNDNKLIFSPGA